MYFFIEDTATTEIYTYRHTLSLHNALPISATPASIKRLERGHHRHRRLAGEDSQPVIAARSRGIEAFDQPFIKRIECLQYPVALIGPCGPEQHQVKQAVEDALPPQRPRLSLHYPCDVGGAKVRQGQDREDPWQNSR